MDAQSPQPAHEGPWEKSYRFEPADLGLRPGDEVAYWAEAEDNKEPTPGHSETAKRWITIVEPESRQAPGQPPNAAQRDPQQGPNDDQNQPPDQPPDEDQRPQQDRPQEAAEALVRLHAGVSGEVALLGTGVSEYPEVWPGGVKGMIHEHPTPGGLARLCRRYLEMGWTTEAMRLLPLYIRRPDAQPRFGKEKGEGSCG